MAITGLSMAALADPVNDATEAAKAMTLLGTSYPEYAAFPMPREIGSRISRRFSSEE
jgi:hypothetical protein